MFVIHASRLEEKRNSKDITLLKRCQHSFSWFDKADVVCYLTYKYTILLVVNEPTVPEVDLGFIISVGSREAVSNTQHLKNVIKSFINKYAMHRLQYGIISYGSTPKIELTLADSLKPDVMQRVEAIVMPGGTPDLAKALELGEGLVLPGRANAQKVLVIITDVKSGSSTTKVKLAAESLNDKDIRVFAVALGSGGDSDELAVATGSDKNIINTSRADEPGKIREDIMDKIRQGKLSKITRFTGQSVLYVTLRVSHSHFSCQMN